VGLTPKADSENRAQHEIEHVESDPYLTVTTAAHLGVIDDSEADQLFEYLRRLLPKGIDVVSLNPQPFVVTLPPITRQSMTLC